MRKVLVSVAPVDALAAVHDPQAIARDVDACYHAGAGMVHLHCRDRHGQLTADPSVLQKTVDAIRERCPIVIQVSTGGISDLTIEERCVPCRLDWAESHSLNVGSVNLGDAVYLNPLRDVRYCMEQIFRHGKIPEVEVFELGMIHTAWALFREFSFSKPLLFSFVFGHFGAIPATSLSLQAMIHCLYEHFTDPSDVLWGITQAHRQDWNLVSEALSLGARTVRVGFEDSHFLSPAAKADTNAALVTRCVRLIWDKGFDLYTPDDTRRMLKMRADTQHR